MIFFWCFADFVVSWIPCCFGSFFFVCAAAKTAMLFPFYGQIPYRTDTSYTSYISPHEISGLSWLMHLYNLWWYFNEIKHYKLSWRPITQNTHRYVHDKSQTYSILKDFLCYFHEDDVCMVELSFEFEFPIENVGVDEFVM